MEELSFKLLNLRDGVDKTLAYNFFATIENQFKGSPLPAKYDRAILSTQIPGLECHAYIARWKEEVRGIVVYKIQTDKAEAERRSHIDLIHVDARFQKNGVGFQLFNLALVHIEKMNPCGIITVDVLNDSVRRMIDKQSPSVRGRIIDRVEMEQKKLIASYFAKPSPSPPS